MNRTLKKRNPFKEAKIAASEYTGGDTSLPNHKDKCACGHTRSVHFAVNPETHQADMCKYVSCGCKTFHTEKKFTYESLAELREKFKEAYRPKSIEAADRVAEHFESPMNQRLAGMPPLSVMQLIASHRGAPLELIMAEAKEFEDTGRSWPPAGEEEAARARNAHKNRSLR